MRRTWTPEFLDKITRDVRLGRIQILPSTLDWPYEDTLFPDMCQDLKESLEEAQTRPENPPLNTRQVQRK